MALSDRGTAAGAAGTLGVVGDLAINGGELVFGALAFLLTNPETWVTALMYGEQLANKVSWLPKGILSTALTFGFVLMIGVSLARLIHKWRESR